MVSALCKKTEDIMKKIWILLVTLILGAALLSACNPSDLSALGLTSGGNAIFASGGNARRASSGNAG